MRRLLVTTSLVLCLAVPAGAKPIITSSEETLSRICLAADQSLDRLVDACTGALAEPGLTRAQRVDLLVSLADVHSWRDEDQQAQGVYEQALDVDPRSVEAWNGLGWVLRMTDGDAAALIAFDRSLAIDVSVQGLAGRASTAREIGAITGTEARELLRAATAIDPDYMWALREIAWSLHDEARYADAKVAFDEALAKDPLDANAVYGLARVQLKLGEAEAALDNLNQVVGDAPEHFAALVYRIIALRELDRNAQAIREADRVIADYPDKSSGYIEKGLAQMALERREDAIRTFAEADAALGPNNAILYWYADALTYDGRMAEALQVIDRGLALDGADYSDFLLKSYIALELKDYSLAKQAAEASLNTGVDDPWAHYYIAISLVHGGKVDAALGRFATAIEGGLPGDRVGAFARELVGAGMYVEAAQLRLKY